MFGANNEQTNLPSSTRESQHLRTTRVNPVPVPRKKGTANSSRRDHEAAQIHATPATEELREEKKGAEGKRHREEGHSAHIVPLPGLVHQRRLPAGTGARSVHRRRPFSRE